MRLLRLRRSSDGLQKPLDIGLFTWGDQRLLSPTGLAPSLHWRAVDYRHQPRLSLVVSFR